MKKKLVFINNNYFPNEVGGAEKSIKIITEALFLSGYDVYVVSLHSDSRVTKETINGVKVYRIPLFNFSIFKSNTNSSVIKKFIFHLIDMHNIFITSSIKKILNEIKPDIVSLHNLNGFSLSILNLIKKLNIQTIQVLHDYYYICPKKTCFSGKGPCKKQCLKCKLFRFGFRKKSNQVNAVVGVSQFVIDKHIENGFFSNVQIKAIINNTRNINLNTLNLTSLKERFNNDAINFGFLGQISPNKGVDILVNQFHRVSRESDKLIIAGSGNQDYLKNLNNLSSRKTIFLGRVDPDVFFKKIDVLIVPSIWNDPYPGVIFESFIFEKPVIGSNLGGIPEIIEHNIYGLIYDSSNTNNLGDKMKIFMENKNFYNLIVKNIQKRKLYFNNPERVINSYEQLYKKLLSFKNEKYSNF